MTAGRAALLASALLLATACSDDPGSDQVDDARAVYVGDPSADAFAALVAAVADDGADGETAQTLADALPTHLDELTDLERADVVGMFESLLDDDATDGPTLDALSGWVVTLMVPLVDGDATVDDTVDTLKTDVAPVVEAAMAGAARTDDLSRGQLLRAVTRDAREIIATQIAARDGLGEVEPGEFAETLSSAWPSGDPIVDLEMAASRLGDRHPDDDSDW